MPIPAYHCAILRPGDRLWVSLLGPQAPVLVTVEEVRLDRDSAGDVVWATLRVRTVLGNVVTICHGDILRRAS